MKPRSSDIWFECVTLDRVISLNVSASDPSLGIGTVMASATQILSGAPLSVRPTLGAWTSVRRASLATSGPGDSAVVATLMGDAESCSRWPRPSSAATAVVLGYRALRTAAATGDPVAARGQRLVVVEPIAAIGTGAGGLTSGAAFGRHTGDTHQIATRVGSLAVRIRGDGPPAVLWHSLFVDERSWKRIEDALARDRRLVIINGPGHGESSDPDRRYTIDDCAAAAREVLTALDIRDAVDWVGNAWGGHVGIVSCVDVARPVSDAGHIRVARPGIQAVASDGGSSSCSPHTASPGWRTSWRTGSATSCCRPGPLNDPEAVALVLDSLHTMRKRALADAMVSISLRRPDLTPRLGSIRCPTAFVTGSDHSGWSPEQAEAKSRLLANGLVAVVPDTAYLIPLEAPQATIEHVRDVWAARTRANTA